MKLSLTFGSLLIAFPSSAAVEGSAGVECLGNCEGDVCTYTAKVNLFAGELGYYTFEECGDAVNPTIGVQVGKTYRFVQVWKYYQLHLLI